MQFQGYIINGTSVFSRREKSQELGRKQMRVSERALRVPRTQGAAITTVHGRRAPVNETARAVQCTACTDLQRGCLACRKTVVPATRGDNGGVTKLAGVIGLLLPFSLGEVNVYRPASA